MNRRRPGRALAGLLALLLAGCATLSPQQRSAAAAVAVDARSTEVDCVRADACALPLRHDNHPTAARLKHRAAPR